jgi:hypothetical protein
MMRDLGSVMRHLSRLWRKPEPTASEAARILSQRAAERRKAERSAYVAAHIKAIRESMK